MQIVLLIKLNWNFMIFILGSPYIYHVCEEFSHLWAKHFDYAMNIFKQLLKQRTIDLCALTHRQVFFLLPTKSIHSWRIRWFFFRQANLWFTIFICASVLLALGRLWTVYLSIHPNRAANCSPVDIVQFLLHPLLQTH